MERKMNVPMQAVINPICASKASDANYDTTLKYIVDNIDTISILQVPNELNTIY
jgi:hypothetical protein